MTDNQNGNTELTMPIFPQVEWTTDAFTRRVMTLDLYDDMIMATRYDENGTEMETYCVDPLDLAGRLSGLSVTTGLLPRNCLFWSKLNGQERIGIYVEPRVWPVNLSREKRTWQTPMPGLVFVGHGTKYRLWAVKGQQFPTLTAPLYHAPCPNVSDYVCRGNAPFPVASAETIWQAVDAFFSSGFNAHLDNEKSKKYPDSVVKMWRELHRARADAYPEDDLVSAGKTLEAVL